MGKEYKEKDYDEPFIIMKYRVYSMGRESIVYEKVNRPDKATSFITRKNALKIIDENDMKIACRDGDEVIWEMPLKPFYAKYRLYYLKKKRR